jgi:hypothetical protein
VGPSETGEGDVDNVGDADADRDGDGMLGQGFVLVDTALARCIEITHYEYYRWSLLLVLERDTAATLERQVVAWRGKRCVRWKVFLPDPWPFECSAVVAA